MKPRPIKITPVLNGFVVEVGCQCVVFTSVAQLSEEVGKYYARPRETEDAFRTGSINRALIAESEPGCDPRIRAQGLDALANVAPMTLGQCEQQVARDPERTVTARR